MNSHQSREKWIFVIFWSFCMAVVKVFLSCINITAPQTSLNIGQWIILALTNCHFEYTKIHMFPGLKTIHSLVQVTKKRRQIQWFSTSVVQYLWTKSHNYLIKSICRYELLFYKLKDKVRQGKTQQAVNFTWRRMEKVGDKTDSIIFQFSQFFALLSTCTSSYYN